MFFAKLPTKNSVLTIVWLICVMLISDRVFGLASLLMQFCTDPINWYEATSVSKLLSKKSKQCKSSEIVFPLEWIEWAIVFHHRACLLAFYLTEQCQEFLWTKVRVRVMGWYLCMYTSVMCAHVSLYATTQLTIAFYSILYSFDIMNSLYGILTLKRSMRSVVR